MYEVKSVIRPERLAAVVHALHEIPDVPGLTISIVQRVGKRMLATPAGSTENGETEMARRETVVSEQLLQRIVDTVRTVGRTGRAGDGNIFVLQVEDAIKVGSGARSAGVL